MTQCRDNEYVLFFLQGLNDNYVAIQAQILLMQHLPNLNKVFSLIIQHKRQLHKDLYPEPTILAAAYNFQSSSKGQFQPQENRSNPNNFFNKTENHRQRTYYNRTNDTVETCFLKHGFPPGVHVQERH